MAQSFELSAEDLAHRLTQSFQVNIQQAIEEELAKVAAPTIKKIAEQMARNIKGKIRTHRDPVYGTMQVMIWIDGVEHKPEKPI